MQFWCFFLLIAVIPDRWNVWPEIRTLSTSSLISNFSRSKFFELSLNFMLNFVRDRFYFSGEWNVWIFFWTYPRFQRWRCIKFRLKKLFKRPFVITFFPLRRLLMNAAAVHRVWFSCVGMDRLASRTSATKVGFLQVMHMHIVASYFTTFCTFSREN